VFESYTQQVLCNILHERVSNLANPKALEWISRRVAAHAGDARMALEFAADALKKAYKDWVKDNVSICIYVYPFVIYIHTSVSLRNIYWR
jgi:Cdc6-like AAA superfamily ATPase